MKEEDFRVISSTDGLLLKGRIICPEDEIKGVLLVVHGMCEHKERYFDFMRYVAENGYACAVYDHRGHGESIRSEEELGYFYRDGKAGIVSDIQDVVLFLKDKFGVTQNKLKFFLLGHSMGSLAVRCYLKKWDDELDGLLVIGSPSKRSGVFFGRMLVRIMQTLKGSRAHSKFLDYLAVNSPYERRFAAEKLPHAWICSDRKIVDAYNLDERCNFTFTVNGYKVLFWLMEKTYNKKKFQLKNQELPICFLSGAEDPCMMNEKAFKKSVENLEKTGYRNVTSKLFENMRHEILNEKEKEQAYNEIIGFLLKNTQ